MKNLLAPPPCKEKLPPEKIDGTCKRLRLQVFLGIFLGYAAYYLVRKNFSLAMPYLQTLGFDKSELGFAFAFNATAYGISKFIMGGISDRSDARKFLALGLILASAATMLAGTAFGVSSIAMMALFQFLIGWFGGMGWPPCGRVMTHWFSVRERGTKMSFWNVAHNVGGGLVGVITAWGVTFALSLGFSAGLSQLLGIFWLPAAIAVLVALIAWLLIRDTPQSCGLPSIEEYRNDYPPNYSEKSETVLKTKDIFFKYVFPNRILWIVALANAFVYFVRYGVLDWAPTYLSEVKGYNIREIGFAYSLYEWAAIPGTILCGWISDAVFKGKRAITTIIFMALVMAAIFVYWKNIDSKLIDSIALVAIGFLIYGPVMLIGVHALDLSPKNAAGTSAGLTGFFGYFFGTSILANIVMGKVAQTYGWDSGFELLIASCLVSILLMALTHRQEQRAYREKKIQPDMNREISQDRDTPINK
ncbi:MAG: phosphoglycerate transporter protein PgtP [Bacteroidales bacterium]|jgi:OPA family glycerol-3-phosphate transporter-like MFS transporter|nr:phosphoglycerate transporter protein PgtP [Bacteroidales bacterium]